MNISNVIEKVQKLLALSTSSNANEAAAAAAAANKLMDKYRLSEDDLEVSSEGFDAIEEDPDYIYQTGKITPWKHILMHVLIRHYGCAHYNDNTFEKGRKFSRFRLVGRRSDITICKYMFSWLTLECQRLANIEVKGCGRVFIASYCEGFVHGVAEQLKKSRIEVQATATSAAIVKLDARSQEATKRMNELHKLSYKKASSYRQTDRSAYSMGKERGQNIHLGSAMSSGSTTKMLTK